MFRRRSPAPRACALPRLVWPALLSLAACGAAPEGPPSVLLVVVDTLRRDALGAYGGASGPDSLGTPALDAFAADAVRFDAAYAAAPWTLPSVATLLTGVSPEAHGALRAGERELRGIDPSLPTLAELLADAGYRTGAVVTNPYLGANFGLARGFETYAHLRAPGRRDKVRGDAIVDEALEWLEAADDRPDFLLVHLFDPHMGYDPPGDLRPAWLAAEPDPETTLRDLLRRLWAGIEDPSPELRARVRDLYDREVHHADLQFARLAAALEADGRPWMVVVTSDHGEEFWDHGGFEHGHSLFEELVRVPLLVRWPAGRGPGAGARSDLARHLDLARTVLAAAGVEALEGLDGRDLAVPPAADAAPVATVANTLYGAQARALVAGGFKLVQPDAGPPALFDLEADPLERHDLAGERPELVEALALELERRAEPGVGRAVELDDELRSELEALGYLR